MLNIQAPAKGGRHWVQKDPCGRSLCFKGLPKQVTKCGRTCAKVDFQSTRRAEERWEVRPTSSSRGAIGTVVQQEGCHPALVAALTLQVLKLKDEIIKVQNEKDVLMQDRQNDMEHLNRIEIELKELHEVVHRNTLEHEVTLLELRKTHQVERSSDHYELELLKKRLCSMESEVQRSVAEVATLNAVVDRQEASVREITGLRAKLSQAVSALAESRGECEEYRSRLRGGAAEFSKSAGATCCAPSSSSSEASTGDVASPSQNEASDDEAEDSVKSFHQETESSVMHSSAVCLWQSQDHKEDSADIDKPFANGIKMAAVLKVEKQIEAAKVRLSRLFPGTRAAQELQHAIGASEACQEIQKSLLACPPNQQRALLRKHYVTYHPDRYKVPWATRTFQWLNKHYPLSQM